MLERDVVDFDDGVVCWTIRNERVLFDDTYTPYCDANDRTLGLERVLDFGDPSSVPDGPTSNAPL